MEKYIYLLVLLQFAIYVNCKDFSVQDELDKYSTCDNQKINLPAEFLEKGLVAAAKCIGYDDEMCFRLCVGYNYGETIKNNKVNVPYIKQQAAKIDLSDKPELKAKLDQLIVEGAKCADGMTFHYPSTDDKCSDIQSLKDCTDDAFDRICKGKIGHKKTDASFLDTAGGS